MPNRSKNMLSRRIYNPIQKDAVTFLKTSSETNGTMTMIGVELAAGGGVALHYHTRFTETFRALDGPLYVQMGEETRLLRNGAEVTAQIGQLHRFFNPTNDTIKFIVEIRPGDSDFENALRVGYGLAADGRTTEQSIPKNLLELAILAEWSNTVMVGTTATLVRPIFSLLLRQAKRRGVDKRLWNTYCRAGNW